MMNLKPIFPTKPPFYFSCCACGKRTASESETGPQPRADLDGKPFRDYYCGPCARHIQVGKMDRETF